MANQVDQVNLRTGPIPHDDIQSLVPMNRNSGDDSSVMGTFLILVNVSSLASPQIEVVVWYTTNNGRVVADKQSLEVMECLPHSVGLKFDTEKTQPGKDVKMSIKGAGKSLCGVGVVDKSVELLSGKKSQITMESVLNKIRSDLPYHYGRSQFRNLEYCEQKYPDIQTRPAEPSIGKTYGFTEALKMFNDAGFLVFTDFEVEKYICNEMFIQKNKRGPVGPPVPIAMSGVAGSEPFTRVQSESLGSPPPGAPAPAPPPHASFADAQFAANDRTQPEPIEAEETRDYLPETWLWEIRTLPETGELSEEVAVPDTVTEWVGSAVCVHPSEGLGISSQASVTTFLPFFVDVTMPSFVKRGEVLPVKVSVFNYGEKCIPVSVNKYTNVINI